MFNIKKILSILTVISLVISLCACGGAGNRMNAGNGGFGAGFPDVDLSEGIKVTDEKITITCGFDLVELAFARFESSNKFGFHLLTRNFHMADVLMLYNYFKVVRWQRGHNYLLCLNVVQ